MNKCSNKECHAPDVGCSLGETDLSQCEHWNSTFSESKQAENVIEKEIHLPWTGLTFGLDDVGFLTGCSKPKIIGILGAENAGKTSLLAAWYLLISRGSSATLQRQFAGSYTLAGWEAVAANLRWEPGHTPSFPAHTPSGSKRAPGLLHLSFRNEKDGIIEDYLFADAPGEWFNKWATHSEAPEAEGARWLSIHADIFLLVADRQALSGEQKGRTRAELNRLIKRIGSTIQNRPIALVWSKSDIKCDELIEHNIRTNVLGAIPHMVEFETQIIHNADAKESSEKNILTLLKWILKQKMSICELPIVSYKGNDPLFMLGQGS